MSFATGLALSPDNLTAVVTNQVTYDLTVMNGPSSIRRVAGLDLDTPKVLTISHETVAKTGVKRHLVRFDHTFQDATDPTIVGTISFYVNVIVPPVVATFALVEDMAATLQNFLSTSGNLAKILNEEI
jgi:hypothetical protein